MPWQRGAASTWRARARLTTLHPPLLIPRTAAGPLAALAGLLSSVPAHAMRAAALAAGAAALAALARFCAGMRQNFVFQDYVHAHI